MPASGSETPRAPPNEYRIRRPRDVYGVEVLTYFSIGLDYLELLISRPAKTVMIYTVSLGLSRYFLLVEYFWY